MTPTVSPQVRVLLFDLGGVLIDVAPERAFAHWASASGQDVAGIRARFQIDAAYHAHERGEITESAWFTALRAQLGVALDEAQLAAGWNALLGEALPGIPALLERAAKLRPMALFSNTNRSHHRVWASQHAGLLAGFRDVFVSCELGRRKPEPKAFDEVAQALACPPEHILFFDDVPENVEGARTAGLQALRVRSGADIERALDQLEAQSR